MNVDAVCLYDRLLVKVIEGDERTSSGLIVPQIARDNTPFLRGEIVSAGHGRVTMNGDTVPLSVKVGDVVIFVRTNNGEQLVWPAPSGDDLLIIREPHVCLILKDLPRATGLVDQDGKQVIEVVS